MMRSESKGSDMDDRVGGINDERERKPGATSMLATYLRHCEAKRSRTGPSFAMNTPYDERVIDEHKRGDRNGRH